MPVRSIRQLNRSSMSLSDLLRKYKADSSTARLGRVKRHKQIAGIGQSGSIIEDRNNDLRARSLPRNIYVALRFPSTASGLRGRVSGIANQIDQCLFDMILIDLQHYVVRRRYSHSDTPLQLRKRVPPEPPATLHSASAQADPSIVDKLVKKRFRDSDRFSITSRSTFEVGSLARSIAQCSETASEAPRNRLDRRQRVV